MAASISTNSISLFRNAAAQPGWTKLTTFNEYMLRVVNGTASSVAASPFSTVFANSTISGSVTLSGTVGNVTLQADQIIKHTHPVNGRYLSPTPTRVSTATPTNVIAISQTTTSASTYNSPATGGGGAHTHSLANVSVGFTGGSIDFSVKYVDVIVAQRN